MALDAVASGRWPVAGVVAFSGGWRRRCRSNLRYRRRCYCSMEDKTMSFPPAKAHWPP
ncbi:hypothetical protein [Sodalis glossinidius]|uniref:hypothetical protein n=1 Tax=Sodalis glossinidius TaxID=63612 RepID=UPI001FB1433B|nr:hypothetical protein [Sodalis glossinidius]